MTLKEAEVLVTNWYNAVASLWSQVIDKAKAGTVAVPIVTKEIGGIKIIMSNRGIEVVVGSTGSSFTKLITMPEFKITEFPNIRKFVVDAIKTASTDVDKAIEDREEAFGTAFNDLKREIAEWNLTCDKGRELK
jgi:hypothetical protein